MVSCSLFVDLDGLSGEASLDGGDLANDGGDTGCPGCETGSDAKAPLEAGVDAGPCPSGLPGPALVQAAGFCIDATEVTVAQYKQFTSSSGAKSQPPECSWNNSYAPYTSGNNCTADTSDATKHPNWPASCIDWCDARAYCAWAGKTMCGAVPSGETVPFAQATTPGAEWFLACATTALHPYPTGDSYDGGCNVYTADAGPRDVAADPRCVGGYPGIFDLAGNAEEWIAACDDAGAGDPSQDHCHEGGDAWGYASNGVAHCDNADYDTRSTYYFGVGFRCCSPLTQ